MKKVILSILVMYFIALVGVDSFAENIKINKVVENGFKYLYAIGGSELKSNYVLQWDGQRWGILGGRFNAEIGLIAESPSGEVYVISSDGSDPNNSRPVINKWNSDHWIKINSDIKLKDARILAAGFSKNGVLYVSGLAGRATFYPGKNKPGTYVDHTNKFIAAYDGITWVILHDKLPFFSDYILPMTDKMAIIPNAMFYLTPKCTGNGYVGVILEDGNLDYISSRGIPDELPYTYPIPIIFNNSLVFKIHEQEMACASCDATEWSALFQYNGKWDAITKRNYNNSDVGLLKPVTAKGELYALKITNGIYYFDGVSTTKRIDAPREFDFRNNDSRRIAVSDADGNLYFIGSCAKSNSMPDSSANSVAKWDGAKWDVHCQQNIPTP